MAFRSKEVGERLRGKSQLGGVINRRLFRRARPTSTLNNHPTHPSRQIDNGVTGVISR